ncbi:MAG TPA: hypothetical protein VK249_25510 [Anaerolineales bacterium]|nr:hypothetical protein [Anaerolineales bacterium]
MAKRAKASGSEAEMVKVVDPLYDAPVVVDPQPEAPSAASRPGIGQRLRRFFVFLLRLLALVVILGILGIGLYYGLPLLYQKYVTPVEQNTFQVKELLFRQKQTEQELAGLQAKLKTLETGQSQNSQSLTRLDQRVGVVEKEITARTQSLAALERMQSELRAQDQSTSAELQRQINLLKAMELLSRARLFLYESNFGLARQDVQIARDALVSVQPDAPETLADDLAEVVRRLDLTLSNLPDFPVAASDDLDIAWQVLLSGLPPAQTNVDRTPAPAVTLSPTSTAAFTPTAQATITPSPTP